MFRATFGGKTCYGSANEVQQLEAEGLPIPPDFYRATSFWNPLGPAAGKGWLLMRRRDIDALDLNALHDLRFEHEPESGAKQVRMFRSLVIACEPRNLFPGFKPNDPDSLYLVEVADVRHLLDNDQFTFPINKQYNVRAYAHLGAGDATEYLADSLNSGTLWTWATMIADVWTLMAARLGAAPALPVTPHGTPEGFIFQGGSAWRTLNVLLSRIGCAISADLSQVAGSQFSIVQVGAADAATDAILSRWETSKVYDAEWVDVIRGVTPYGVRVFFHRQEQYPGLEQTTPRTASNWQTGSAYSVDVAGPDAASAEPGTYHPIWDDLPAIYDSTGTLTNTTALGQRAQERADDFFRQNRAEELHKTYPGFMPIAPGSTLRAVMHRDGVDGATTEIVRHPYLYFRAAGMTWEPLSWMDSTRLHAPDLSPSWPAQQAQLVKILEIENGTPASNRYDCTVQLRDSAGGWLEKESVYAVDLAGAASLTAGDRYDGLLVGYEGSRPLFAIDSRGTPVEEICTAYEGEADDTLALTNDTWADIPGTDVELVITAEAEALLIAVFQFDGNGTAAVTVDGAGAGSTDVYEGRFVIDGTPVAPLAKCSITHPVETKTIPMPPVLVTLAVGTYTVKQQARKLSGSGEAITGLETGWTLTAACGAKGNQGIQGETGSTGPRGKRGFPMPAIRVDDSYHFAVPSRPPGQSVKVLTEKLKTLIKKRTYLLPSRSDDSVSFAAPSRPPGKSERKIINDLRTWIDVTWNVTGGTWNVTNTTINYTTVAHNWTSVTWVVDGGTWDITNVTIDWDTVVWNVVDATFNIETTEINWTTNIWVVDGGTWTITDTTIDLITLTQNWTTVVWVVDGGTWDITDTVIDYTDVTVNIGGNSLWIWAANTANYFQGKSYFSGPVVWVHPVQTNWVSNVCPINNTFAKTVSGTTSITSDTLTDLTGSSSTFSMATSADVHITAIFDFNGDGAATVADQFEGHLIVDTVDQSGVATFGVCHASHRSTVSQAWVINLGSGSHTIKLQAKRVAASGGDIILGENTRWTLHADTELNLERRVVYLPTGTQLGAYSCEVAVTCCPPDGGGNDPDGPPGDECPPCDQAESTWSVTIADASGCTTDPNGAYTLAKVAGCFWQGTVNQSVVSLQLSEREDGQFDFTLYAENGDFVYSGIGAGTCCTDEVVTLDLVESTCTMPATLSLTNGCVPGVDCAGALEIAAGVTYGPFTLAGLSEHWFKVEHAGGDFNATINASAISTTPNDEILAYNGTCEALNDLSLTPAAIGIGASCHESTVAAGTVWFKIISSDTGCTYTITYEAAAC